MVFHEGCLLIIPFIIILSLKMHCRYGHASMVDEVKEALHGITPDLMIISVGGGGLMNGVLEGMHRVGWAHIPVLAMETQGADSLNACVKAGKWVALDQITR